MSLYGCGLVYFSEKAICLLYKHNITKNRPKPLAPPTNHDQLQLEPQVNAESKLHWQELEVSKAIKTVV